jgi:hypothetical protein
LAPVNTFLLTFFNDNFRHIKNLEYSYTQGHIVSFLELKLGSRAFHIVFHLTFTVNLENDIVTEEEAETQRGQVAYPECTNLIKSKLQFKPRQTESTACFLFIFVCLFVRTGVSTQGFALSRQALYHLNHDSSPFCSGYFGNRVSLFTQAIRTTVLQFIPSGLSVMTGTYHCTQLFLLEMGVSLAPPTLPHCCPGLAWNHDPPNLSLSSS